MTPKTLARIAGWAISLACLAFFVRHVQKVGISTPGHAVIENIGFVLAGSILYAAAVLILALTWAMMLRRALPPGTGPRPLVESYLLGQFAKYLPGNVLQYAARHGLGVKAGISHSQLIGAAFSEIYLLICSGAAIAVAAGLPELTGVLDDWPALPNWLCILPLAAAFAVSAPAKFLPATRWLPNLPVGQVATATCGYLAFFAAFGGLYWLCLAWSIHVGVDPAPALSTASFAWLAGFVIPGAPAGAGLREAVLSVGMAPLPTAEVAASIVLFRLITLGGDFVAFIGGWLLSRGKAPNKNIEARKPYT